MAQSINYRQMVLDTIAHALTSYPNPEMRAKAAESLGKLGDQAATPFLLTALADSNLAVQHKAIQALGHLGDEAAVPHLLQVLENGAAPIRQAAAAALGHIGSRRSSVIYSGALERLGRRYHAEHGDNAARGSDY